MVKITNITSRTLYRRTPAGTVLCWDAGQTRDVESKRLIAELEGSNGFQVGEAIGKETHGGGITTHVRPPKRRGRPPKSKTQEKVDKLAKGLKKKSKKTKKQKAD